MRPRSPILGEEGRGVKALPWRMGSNRMGPTHRFFLRRRSFDYFSRNQTFQTCAAGTATRHVSIFNGLACVRSARERSWSQKRAFIFSPCSTPGAGQISGNLSPGTAWGQCAQFRKIQKTFFSRKGTGVGGLKSLEHFEGRDRFGPLHTKTGN